MLRTVLSNLPAGGRTERRDGRRACRPEAAPLEGRALLSGFFAHAAPVEHAALVHRPILNAAVGTVTPLAPGQFGPNSRYPFAGIRGGSGIHAREIF
jgi:hypothetical protein